MIKQVDEKLYKAKQQKKIRLCIKSAANKRKKGAGR